MEDSRDHRRVAEEYFPGGSFGNGAAMRVAPVGLAFRDDRRALWEQARASALPTHVHPLGIEGAQLLALAVALCTRMQSFDRSAFFAELRSACESDSYQSQLAAGEGVGSPEGLAALGNWIEALYSVPTAIASFALTPESFADTIGNVILLGGDTDTLGAVAGALSGADLGRSRLPTRLVGLLEDGPKGRRYLIDLAGKLLAGYNRASAGTRT